MVNIKPMMGPVHPEIKHLEESDEIKTGSSRHLSPEGQMDFTKRKNLNVKIPKLKKKMADLLSRLNILSNRP